MVASMSAARGPLSCLILARLKVGRAHVSYHGGLFYIPDKRDGSLKTMNGNRSHRLRVEEDKFCQTCQKRQTIFQLISSRKLPKPQSEFGLAVTLHY